MMKRLGHNFLSTEFFVWLPAMLLLIVWPTFISYRAADRRLSTLVQRGQTADGHLIQRKDHNQIVYSFVTQGHRYEGEGKGPEGLKAGAAFNVYFDPENPTNNLSEEPERQLAGLGSGYILIAICLSCMLAFIIKAVGKLVRTSLAQSRASTQTN